LAKIIFINRFFYPDHSATSQLLSDLAFYLARNNVEIDVICARQLYSGGNDNLESNEKVNGVNIHRIKTTQFGRNWLPGRLFDYLSYYINMSICLIRLLKAGDLVICKTDPPLSSVITVSIARFKQAKHVNWIQDLFPEVFMALGMKGIPLFLLRWIQLIRNWSFKKSHLTVVIGQVMKNKLISEGVDESKIQVIPNWSDSENIVPLEKENNPLRKKWNLENKFIVGYSGNMGRVHEFDTILQAAKLLNDDHKIKFIFIGGGPKKGYIEDWVKKQNLNNVLFYPYQAYSDLRYSLSLPDVHLISLNPEIEGYCVPSKFYGVTAAGRPIIFIGNEKGELTFPIRNGDFGSNVISGDVQHLVTEIITMASDERKIRTLGAHARNMFESEFDKPIPLKKWLLLIEDLI